MTNSIKHLHIINIRLDPTEVEVGIYTHLDRVTSTTQIRGRMMGPHCPYATTIEVAYLLRESSREYEKYGIPQIGSRVVIPEPNFWDPVSPFLYHIALELWQGGVRCEKRAFTYALKQFALGPSGISWNGRPLLLRGVRNADRLEVEAAQLRQSGYNTIVAPVTSNSADLWDSADRLGFLMIGRVTGKREGSQAYDLRQHPSRLGWLVSPEFLDQELNRVAAEALLCTDGQIMGVELASPTLKPLPKWISFVACEESALPNLEVLELPKLILRSEKTARPAESEDQVAQPGILGWVE